MGRRKIVRTMAVGATKFDADTLSAAWTKLENRNIGMIEAHNLFKVLGISNDSHNTTGICEDIGIQWFRHGDNKVGKSSILVDREKALELAIRHGAKRNTLADIGANEDMLSKIFQSINRIDSVLTEITKSMDMIVRQLT